MELKLNAEPREAKEKMDAEHLAAIVYGKGLESKSLKLNRAEFNKVFAEAGESNLINLQLGEEKTKVLVKEIQSHPIKDWFVHVDLYQVNMKEKLNTEIPLEFTGESKAVKELGGILIKEITEIKVECLPGDLVDHINVDISGMTELEDVIKVSDIKLPEGMELLIELDTIVAMVTEPRVQEEEPVAEQEEALKEGEAKKDGEATDEEKKEEEKK